MRLREKVSTALILGLVMGPSASFAANVTIKGTVPGQVVLHERTHGFASASVTKQISFLHVVLSQNAKNYLANHADDYLKASNLKLKASSLPVSALVGMNGVPVLDQGQHGTCVTFAVTGAIDATINSNKPNTSYDRYSQLCSLELGTTLENQSPVDEYGQHTYPSGWDGTFGTILLEQIKKYGLVSTKYQLTKGCAGVRSYPIDNPYDTGNPMSIKDYKKSGEQIVPTVSYNVILKDEDAFSGQVDMEVVLDKVKKGLASKHVVTFGTLLDVSQGQNGATGSYKSSYDTWVLTPAIAQHAKDGSINAGHEMIIIGYDDEAVVDGQKGILTLRNSWGDSAGDKGNYYMTYDHFKTLAMEVAEYSLSSNK